MPHRISSHRSGAAVRCGRCRTGCEIHPVASRDEIASMTQTRGCRDFAVTDGYRVNPLQGWAPAQAACKSVLGIQVCRARTRSARKRCWPCASGGWPGPQAPQGSLPWRSSPREARRACQRRSRRTSTTWSGRRCCTRSQPRACSCGTRCCARWWTRRCLRTRRRTRPVAHRSRQPRRSCLRDGHRSRRVPRYADTYVPGLRTDVRATCASCKCRRHRAACPEAPRRGGLPASVVPYVPCTVWYTTGTAAAALTLTLTTGTAAASSVVRDVLELEVTRGL